jgi:MFS transporter, CP family, cyanate transporter
VRAYRGLAVAIVLLGAGIGYAASVVGPPAAELADEFDISLGYVGLFTSVLFVGIVALNLVGPWLNRRVRLRNSLLAAPVLLGVGGLVCILASSFAVFTAGRAVVGIAGGIILLMAPIAGREIGGPLLVGLYGGAITIGEALSLVIGGLLADADIDWRVNFIVSALLGASALPFLLGRFPDIAREAGGAAREMLRVFLRFAYWRVALLFTLCVTVPVVVSVWLVHYLTENGAMGASLAGALGFVLFALATVARPLGGKIDPKHHKYLLAASPFIAGAGLAGLALDDAPAIAIPAVIVMGIGFSLPYAVSYIRSEDLVPSSPTAGLSAELLFTNAVPIIATPALGALIEDGHATAGWLILAGFALAAGLVNLPRPPVREHERVAEAAA